MTQVSTQAASPRIPIQANMAALGQLRAAAQSTAEFNARTETQYMASLARVSAGPGRESEDGPCKTVGSELHLCAFAGSKHALQACSPK